MREGWRQTTLGEAVEVTMGRQRSPKHAVGEHVVAYLRAANVKDGRLQLDSVFEMNFSSAEQATFSLRPGDVLVTEGCGSIGQLGAAARWDGEIGGTVCFQNTLLRLRAVQGVTDPGFVDVWARHAFSSGIFAAVASGTNIFHIGSTQAKQIPFLLPPLAEQCRIVDLTSAAEEVHSMASQLLDMTRLAGDRLRDEVFNRLSARTVRLQQSVLVTNGRQRSPKHESGEHMIRYIRAANVKDGRLVLDEPMYMNFTPTEQARYALVPGDVLVTEGCGSLRQIGASCQWQGEIADMVCFQNHLLRLRSADPVATHSGFVYQWALWAFRTGQFASLATGTSIFSLGVTRVSAMPFPDASEADQLWAVALLGDAERVERAAASYASAIARARSQVGADLLSGNHQIPDSYDAFLKPAS